MTVSLARTFAIKMVRASSVEDLQKLRFLVTIVIAAQSIANIVKSSLGPLGLDKMLVDNIGVRVFDPK